MFNLIEAYLNGIAWDVVQDSDRLATLPSTEQGALQNISTQSLKWKLKELPRIVGRAALPATAHAALAFILDNAKPLRDALVHPSPFPTPAKYGGHDKLGLFYSIDATLASRTLGHGVVVLDAIHGLVAPTMSAVARDLPWLEELRAADLRLRTLRQDLGAP